MNVEKEGNFSTTTSYESLNWKQTSKEIKQKIRNPFCNDSQSEVSNNQNWSSASIQETSLDRKQHTSQPNEISSQIIASQVKTYESQKPNGLLEEPPLLEDLGIDLYQIKRKIFFNY